MEDKKTSFHMRSLSDGDIDRLGLSYSDVWMIKFSDGKKHGPYSTDMLREDSQKNTDLYEKCQAFNMVTEEWKPFFKLPEFQRRKPKLVAAQNLIKSEDFLLLINGQKSGPYSLDQLKDLIAGKKITLTQEVSVDEGKTWIKLYEHHAFDRRHRKGNEELPFRPEGQVFEEADHKTASIILNLEKQKEESSIISSLAFIGRAVETGKIKLEKPAPRKVKKKYVKVSPHTEEVEEEPKKSSFKSFIGAGAIALIAAVFIFGGGKEKSQEPKGSIGQSPVEDIRTIDNSDRSTTIRKPASAEKAAPSPTRPKRYVPPARPVRQRKVTRPSKRLPPTRTQRETRPKRITHTYEKFDNMDLDDPAVRDELSRDLAGQEDYYEERDQDYGVEDAEGNYPADNRYPEDRREENDDYGRQEKRYPEDDAPYDRMEEPPYEEYSDFE